MFTHLLNNDSQIFGVYFSKYAIGHYLKNFKKKYKGKQWDFTELSIKQDLSRLSMKNNTTQTSAQIDELKYNNNRYLAKYDFKIAATKESTKGSGNRCILYIDNNIKKIDILLIYNKTDLPKNSSENDFIYGTIKKEYPDISSTFQL